MESPKYQVGQKVAVLAYHSTAGIMCCIPQATVTALEFFEGGELYRYEGRVYPSAKGWRYWVAGEQHHIPERYLRPYRDDDYLESTQHQEEAAGVR
jgi:hypothetical protein